MTFHPAVIAVEVLHCCSNRPLSFFLFLIWKIFEATSVRYVCKSVLCDHLINLVCGVDENVEADCHRFSWVVSAPAWLTVFGVSHCLGLSVRSTPQDVPERRRALRKSQHRVRAHSMVPRWQRVPNTTPLFSLDAALSCWSELVGLACASPLEDHVDNSPCPRALPASL